MRLCPNATALCLNSVKKVLAELEQLKLRLAVIDKKIEHYGKLLNGEEDEWSHEFLCP